MINWFLYVFPLLETFNVKIYVRTQPPFAFDFECCSVSFCVKWVNISTCVCQQKSTEQSVGEFTYFFFCCFKDRSDQMSFKHFIFRKYFVTKGCRETLQYVTLDSIYIRFFFSFEFSSNELMHIVYALSLTK